MFYGECPNHNCCCTLSYRFRTYFSQYQNTSSPATWIPIPDFARKDADVSVFFLHQNSVMYPEPVDDPFFAAHRERDGVFEQIYYTADNLTTVMACVEQAQLRNPNTGATTIESAPFLVWEDAVNLALTPGQNASTDRLMVMTLNTGMHYSVYGTENIALEAASSLLTTTSTKLPSNQWQLELISWFEVALAAMQVHSLSFASKDVGNLGPLELFAMDDMPDLASTCHSQIIRNAGGYQSFSVLGVSIIVAIGTLIIIVSLVLDSAVGALRKRFHWKEYKEEAWRTDSMLHQQGLAFEGTSVVKWTHFDTNVPITETGTFFPRIKGL